MMRRKNKDTSPFKVKDTQPVNSAEMPLVSIITAVFNGEKYLEQTIKSVLNQTYARIQYIIIDGGSTDGTPDIIQKYDDRISCWLSEPDNGVYDAWNKGLDSAKGQWIAFVGSDDILYDTAVELYMQHIFQTGIAEIEYVSSKAEIVEDDLAVLRTIGQPWKWEKFQRYHNIVHVGSLHNRRLFAKYGRFNNQYKIAGDYEFLLRAGKHLKAAFMDRVTVKMRCNGISNTTRALYEARQAKTHSGGRNRFLSFWEYCIGYAKFVLKEHLQRN